MQEVSQIESLGNLKLPLPEEEEVILEVKEVDKILVDRLIITLVPMAIVVMVGISMVEIKHEMAKVIIDPLAIGVKLMVPLVEIKGKEAELEVGLTPAQMSEDLE